MLPLIVPVQRAIDEHFRPDKRGFRVWQFFATSGISRC